MDLVFNALPDVFSYQSFRHTAYDAPWLNDVNSNKARRSSDKPRPSPSSQASGGGSSSASCGGRRDSCPLCQEKQRRPLATYIRSKSRQDRREECSIREEEEEEEEDAEAQQHRDAPRRPTATATATST